LIQTRCRQCANLYLHEEGSVTTTYDDPVEGELELEIFKFGLYPIRSIKEHEPLRWHVGSHDIQYVQHLSLSLWSCSLLIDSCDNHLDPDARRLITKHPELQSPHHDCYTDFISEHNVAQGVQLLRPLIHGTLSKSKHVTPSRNPDPEKKDETIILDGQKFQLNSAAADARVCILRSSNGRLADMPGEMSAMR
jgi:hypothetical protein